MLEEQGMPARVARLRSADHMQLKPVGHSFLDSLT